MREILTVRETESWEKKVNELGGGGDAGDTEERMGEYM